MAQRVVDRVFDSARANNSNTNEPIIELKSSLDDIVGACIVSANVPFTYNVIDTSNNVFTLAGTSVTIPSQTLNSGELATELLAAITTAAVTGAANYQAYIDNSTSQLIIYNTAGTSFTLDMSGSRSPYRVLGYAKTTYTSTTVTAYGTLRGNDGVSLTGSYHVIVSPFTVNLSGEGQMYVHCKAIGPAMNGSITNDSNAADIIGDFRVNTNYQGSITYENQAPVPYDCQINSLRTVQMYLTTGSNTTALDLKGAPWQVKVRFFCRKKQVDSVGTDEFGNSNISSVNGGGKPQMRAPVRRR